MRVVVKSYVKAISIEHKPINFLMYMMYGLEIGLQNNEKNIFSIIGLGCMRLID